MLMTIGTIVKPQGIKGEVKVLTSESDTKRYAKLKHLFLNGIKTGVLSFSPQEGYFIAKFEGISDRNDAEKFRGFTVSAYKEDCTLENNEYYFEDLIGCTLVSPEGNVVGTLLEIEQFGSADVFTARGVNNILFSFPFIKSIVTSIDIQKKEIIVNNSELSKNKVYP